MPYEIRPTIGLSELPDIIESMVTDAVSRAVTAERQRLCAALRKSADGGPWRMGSAVVGDALKAIAEELERP